MGIADRTFEQALGIGGGIGGDDFQPGDLRKPSGEILRMLGGDARRRSVGAPKYDLRTHLATRHIERLGCRIDDLVHRLHGEIEGHEFDDRLQPSHRGADAETGEAMFGDRRIDDPTSAEFLQQALRDLVGALIFGDFLAHHEDGFVAAHFFGHRVTQGFAYGHGDHRRPLGDLGRRGDGGCGKRRIVRLFGGLRLLTTLPFGLVGSLGFRRRGAAVHGCFLWRRRRRGDILARGGDDADRRIHGDILGAVGDEDFRQCAFVDRFDFHSRLIGLDLREHIAGFDRIAFFFEPFGELAFLHSRREGGHQNIGRHRKSLPAEGPRERGGQGAYPLHDACK